MKKFLLTLTMSLFASIMIFAQDAEDGKWTHGGFVGLNVSQSNFTNWTSGGQDNVNGLGTLKYDINYHKGKSKWKYKIKTIIRRNQKICLKVVGTSSN